MAITAVPSNASVTHRDGIRAARDIYGASLGISGNGEVGSLTINGVPQLVQTSRTFRGNAAAASIATAGAGTYTAANILTGTIVRDCTGASRVDTLSTAALLVAALAAAFGVAPAIGDCIDFLVVNGSDPVTEIITIAGGTNGTFDANQTDVSKTILGTCSKLIRLRLTNVTALSEAYLIYS